MSKNQDLFNDLVSLKPKKQPNKPNTTAMNQSMNQAMNQTPMNINSKVVQPQSTSMPTKNQVLHDFDVGLLSNHTSPAQSPPMPKPDSVAQDDFMDIFTSKPAPLKPQSSQISEDFSIFNNHTRSTTAPPILTKKETPIPSVIPQKTVEPDTNSLIQQLVQMGFSQSASKHALLMHNNNLNNAVDYLVTGGDITNNQPQQQSLTSSLFSKASKLTSSIKQNISNLAAAPIPSTLPQGTHFNPVDSNKDGLYDNKPSIKPVHHPKQMDVTLTWYSQLDPSTLVQLAENKLKADVLMKQGQYGDALPLYNNHNSQKHPIVALMLLNASNCQLETGLHKHCIDTIELLLKMVSIHNLSINDSISSLVDKIVDQHHFSMSDLLKAFIYKSQALLGLEKYDLALEYTQQIKQCPQIQQFSEMSLIRELYNKTYSTLNKPKQSELVTSLIESTVDVNKSKRVAEMRIEHLQKEKEKDAQLMIKDEVDYKVKQWSLGKESNIRTLLSTVGVLMREIGIDWLDIPVNNLMQPIQIKKAYIKTVSKIHPDKVHFIYLVANF